MKKIETDDQLKKWANGFSATVLKVVLALWTFSMLFGAFIIGYSLIKYGEISEPVNFISEINTSFGASVISILITRTIGNIFQYNDGIIWGTSNNNRSG